MTNSTKQNLFNTLDGFISDIGCAEMRSDELLRDLDESNTAEICKLAERIASDLASTVREFSASIKKIKQL
jgi:hypothetical protein